jgi:prepilin-type N-terminal cleavage/methylation domain-containing protein
MRTHSNESGFSLPELLIAMTIMLIISGAAVTALMKMTAPQATIWNRTQMHSGIRGATEVLQQEVGQAGRIALPISATTALPYTVTMGNVNANPTTAQSVNIDTTMPSSLGDKTKGMFIGQLLTVDTGDNQETITLEAPLTASQITAKFTKTHASNVPVLALGAFGSGIVPPAASPVNYPNGSTDTVLKLYGDINADGNMVYIEYTCDTTTTHNLYRNSMPWNQTTKPAVGAAQILLSNIIANPNGTPCFTYQVSDLVGTNRYVIDVAITLTVETQVIDPVTKQKQTETKALLNVSPRNTYNAWQMASLGLSSRIQPMPPSITALLPPLP